MRVMYVRARVTKPGGRNRGRAVRFLVDTGAVYTVLPEPVWRGLRLRPEREAEFTLADGTIIMRSVSEARFTVGRTSATSPVILGGRSDAPLLGAVTLETLGLMVNPLSRELLPKRLVLAAARRRADVPTTTAPASLLGRWGLGPVRSRCLGGVPRSSASEAGLSWFGESGVNAGPGSRPVLDFGHYSRRRTLS